MIDTRIHYLHAIHKDIHDTYISAILKHGCAVKILMLVSTLGKYNTDSLWQHYFAVVAGYNGTRFINNLVANK